MSSKAVEHVVLGTVGFIGHDDDVRAVAQEVHALPLLFGQEFLNGGKHNSTELPSGELGDEVVLVFDLNWGLTKVILRCIKRREELTVEILPVGNNEHRRILEFRTSRNQTSKEGHG